MGRVTVYALLTFVWFLNPYASSAQSQATEDLMNVLSTTMRVLNSTQPGFDEDHSKAIAHSALEAGPEAIPALRERLRKANRQEESLIAMALAYIGGETAVSTIQSEFKRNHDVGPELAFALASVNSKRNRDLLVRLIKTSDTSDDWATIQMAALSLGIMHAREAIDPLRAIAEGCDGTKAVCTAAKVALRWIQRDSWRVDAELADDRDRIIAAVLQNGLPDERFLDSGLWRKNGSAWSFLPDAEDKGGTAGPGLETFINHSGSRGLVSVSIHCGLLCGYGYDYVLRKVNGKWEIYGVIQTWVS